jgi:hypothetical protein
MIVTLDWLWIRDSPIHHVVLSTIGIRQLEPATAAMLSETGKFRG